MSMDWVDGGGGGDMTITWGGVDEREERNGEIDTWVILQRQPST